MPDQKNLILAIVASVAILVGFQFFLEGPRREAELERLLQDVIPESEDELDVTSFLRRQSGSRSRGFFR